MSAAQASPAVPSPADLLELRARARAVRAATVRMAHDGRTPHVASALSAADILVALYFHSLRIDPANPAAPGLDRFVLSKGHGCMSYYATLAERGYFPREVLGTYVKNGGKLMEHPSPHAVPGLEVATGSLGHGLAIAAGAALARRVDGRPGRYFVLMSDGELNEGTVWEAALFAAREGLDGLVAIVDLNGLTATGRSEDVVGLAPLGEKWRAFGWGALEVDGHDLGALCAALDAVPLRPGAPSMILARTVKGKGVSFMEGDLEWHYRPPGAADLARALAEIEGAGA